MPGKVLMEDIIKANDCFSEIRSTRVDLRRTDGRLSNNKRNNRNDEKYVFYAFADPPVRTKIKPVLYFYIKTYLQRPFIAQML